MLYEVDLWVCPARQFLAPCENIQAETRRDLGKCPTTSICTPDLSGFSILTEVPHTTSLVVPEGSLTFCYGFSGDEGGKGEPQKSHRTCGDRVISGAEHVGTG